MRALNIVAQDETNKPNEKTVFENLLRQVRQGTALSDAMEDQGEAFPELLICLLYTSRCV